MQTENDVVDWKLVGAGLDTEGSISSIVAKGKKIGRRLGYKRDYELAIYQADKNALDILRSFLLRAGVTDARTHKDERTGVWSLKLTRIRDIEFVIRNVEPYLITARKKHEVERFRLFRNHKYKRFSEVAA